ncbi:MAG: hypothetical protein EP347_00660 [Alphaproteobacteria bacterium]|nr:MAG: hypothetical protein EP347_00660 [Alphaproteobacteria bacterium]
MSEQKKSKLEAFLGDIVEDDLRKLVAAVEFDRLSGTRGLPHNTVLDALRPVLREGGAFDRVPTPQRMFCTAFEDLLQTLPRQQKQFGRISRTTINPLWDWLSTEAMPEELSILEEEVTRHILDQNQDAAWDLTLKFQVEVGRHIQKVVDAAIRQPSAFKSLNRHISDSLVLADMRDIANCLLAAPQIRRMQVRFPRPIQDMTSRDIAWFERLYEELVGQERLSAYLLLSLMGRMSRPWEILTVIEVMAEYAGNTEKYIGDWKFSCEVLLSDLEHVATYFDGLRIEKIHWVELHENLAFFVNVGDAIASSNDPTQHPEWVQRIAKCGRSVSKEVGRILERLPAALDLIFYGEGANGTLDVTRFAATGDVSNRVAEVQAIADFLEGTMDYAECLSLEPEARYSVSQVYQTVRHLKNEVMQQIQLCRGAERNAAISYAEFVAQVSNKFKPCFSRLEEMEPGMARTGGGRDFGT